MYLSILATGLFIHPNIFYLYIFILNLTTKIIKANTYFRVLIIIIVDTEDTEETPILD